MRIFASVSRKNALYCGVHLLWILYALWIERHAPPYWSFSLGQNTLTMFFSFLVLSFSSRNLIGGGKSKNGRIIGILGICLGLILPVFFWTPTGVLIYTLPVHRLHPVLVLIFSLAAFLLLGQWALSRKNLNQRAFLLWVAFLFSFYLSLDRFFLGTWFVLIYAWASPLMTFALTNPEKFDYSHTS